MAKAATKKALKKTTKLQTILGTVVTIASVIDSIFGKNNTRSVSTDVQVVKETTDPRNGAVAIVGSEKTKYKVVSERLEFVSDFLPLDEAEKLFEYYAHNSQRQ